MMRQGRELESADGLCLDDDMDLRMACEDLVGLVHDRVEVLAGNRVRQFDGEHIRGAIQEFVHGLAPWTESPQGRCVLFSWRSVNSRASGDLEAYSAVRGASVDLSPTEIADLASTSRIAGRDAVEQSEARSHAAMLPVLCPLPSHSGHSATTHWGHSKSPTMSRNMAAGTCLARPSFMSVAPPKGLPENP